MATGDKRPVVMEDDRAAANGIATLGEDKLLLPDQRPKADGLYMPDGRTIKEAFDGMVHAVSQLVNPNLLDNWYFGNPVDQRQGRVVKPNTTYYSDNTLTTAAGTTSAYVTAYRYATGTASGVNYASFKLTDSDTAPTYYAAPENVVRGYTGRVYGLDRWISESDSTLLVLSDRVRLLGKYQISQFFESPINGTVTVSVLFDNRSGNAFKIFTNDGTGVIERAATINSSGLLTVTFDGSGFTELLIGFRAASSTDTVDIKAAKLELGSQQTLAHQDENGNWVLNEIPDYGEQLARCQRYARFGHIRAVFSQITGNARMYVPLSPIQPPMRTAPSVTYTNIRTYTDGTNCAKINQFGSEADILPGFTISTDVTDNVLQLDYSAISDL